MMPSSAATDPPSPTLIERAVTRRENSLGDAAAAALLGGFAQAYEAPLALKEAESGVYRFVNPAMATLFGREVDEVIGRTDAQLLSNLRAAALRAADQTALSHHPQPSQTDHRFEWHGRRRHYAALRVVVPDPRPAGGSLIASVWIDRGAVDESAQQLQTLRAQLEADQRLIEKLRHELPGEIGILSGDIRVFDDQLRRELDLSTRERREFTLVLIDLDPAVAGTVVVAAPADEQSGDGRPQADLQAIQEASRNTLERLLLANIRAMDATSRLGPDRFAVLLSGVGLATAHTRAESLRRQCAEYVVMVDGEPHSFTVSIGLAAFPHTARGRDDLLRSASVALQQARERGGNQLKLASLPFPRPGLGKSN